MNALISWEDHTRGTEELPPVDENVIATTKIFRCLGCVRRDGKWHSAYNNDLLPEVIAWEPLGQSN